MQHSVSVEIRVIESLQRSLRPTVKFDNWLDYVKFDIEPNRYSSVDQFKRDFAFVSLLRKWKGHVLGIDRAGAAFTTWREAEKRCFLTNKRLELEASTGCYSVAPRIISDAQRKIARILGPLNKEKISELCRFGNGATFDLKRGSTHSEKSCNPTVTFDAIPWACHVLAHDDYLGSLVGPLHDLKIVRPNRMVMVPKSAKVDRPIAAEPTLNSFIQQGFGRYIRHRLKRAGVDLDDQTINQSLASRAQTDGLATIDLSSASDTLCTNLVKLLLPREWFEALDSVRCKFTRFKGKDYLLSKFSSMGNAFTFELESLIFHALISVGCTGVTSVYGDDLIVLQSEYDSALEILDWAGFIPNATKSYGSGRFYESCGRHYFDGVDVTPCFQKDVCRTAHDMVRFANRLVRAGIRLELREEFNGAAQIVRDECRRIYGKRAPGVGPLVEYDEYFIKENYVWASEYADRCEIMSAVTSSPKVVFNETFEGKHTAYLARKLRCFGFLNPDPRGQVSETLKPKLKIKLKYHWRSASS